MGTYVLAWLTGETILVWRWKKAGAPPTPGALLLSSGVFALLALLAQAPQARTLATVTAWGYDLAILLKLFEQGKVSVSTGWPPPMITDSSVIIPTGSAHSAAPPAAGSNPAPGGGVPNPGTGPGGVQFPPGSGQL